MKTPYGDFVEIPLGEFLMGNDQPYLSLNGDAEGAYACEVCALG